jgi:hypothetical protein
MMLKSLATSGSESSRITVTTLPALSESRGEQRMVSMISRVLARCMLMKAALSSRKSNESMILHTPAIPTEGGSKIVVKEHSSFRLSQR